jgi:alcohol dehydrogenase (NADP+)
MENYCPKMLQTYSFRYENGEKTMGGFAKYWRGPAQWVFQIPDGMKPSEVAPMLCGGITSYAPLKRFNCGPGKKIAIIGMGGIGHFAILFAKAMRADKVIVISRTSNKKDDAMKLGADEFIATNEDNEWATKNACSLDLILNFVSTKEVLIPIPGGLVCLVI